jgi:hypothetical protein
MPFTDQEPKETFTGGVLDSLRHWAPAGSDLQIYTAALASMFEAVFELVSHQGSPDRPETYTAGWSTLLDPGACPAWALPFCGMFAGVPVAPGTDETTARQQIRSEQGFKRGTGWAGTYNTGTIDLPAPMNGGAIVLAAQRNLTGSQTVTLLERTAADAQTPDPYHFVLLAAPNEIASEAALTDAVNAVKPGGLQWTLLQGYPATWNQATKTWAAETVSWEQAAPGNI